MSAESRKVVLWIDDDLFSVADGADYLDSLGHIVKHINNANDAFVEINNGQYDLLITDLMMKHGASLSAIGTHGGRRTGVFIARASVRAHPTVPVVIYSLAANLDDIKEESKRLKIHLISKQVYMGKNFSKYVSDILCGKSPQVYSPGKLYDALKIEPSFMGMGVDIKKLIRLFKRG